MAADLPPDQASEGVQQVLRELEETTDSRVLSDLCEALANFGGYVSKEQASVAAQHIVDEMATQSSRSMVFRLGDALGNLGENLPPTQAATGLGIVVSTMIRRDNPLAEMPDATVLSNLMNRLDAEDVVRLLKSVACVDYYRAKLLEQLDVRVDETINGNIWNAVRWAEVQGVDVSSVRRWSLVN